MTLRAHAKINIGLHIIGEREDGYHNIETVFHEINLFDEITIEPYDSLELITDPTATPVHDENLCLKAARLLKAESRVAGGAKIFLSKQIPVAAGLGGGSSDAASTLVGLNTVWKLNLNEEILCRYAAQLGSDPPFFIKGGSAFATGRGEVLDHFQLEIPYWIVVITPPLHVSTAWAYRNMKIHRDGASTDLKNSVIHLMRNPVEFSLKVHNDFESIVFEHYREIKNIKQKLFDAGAVFALMTGSGSSIFAWFEHETTARLAASTFPDTYTIALTPPFFTPRNG